MDYLQDLPLIPLGIASLLGIHGLRKKSLSPSGAVTAFAVGMAMFAGGLRVFGVSIVVFYLTGSRATKYGKQRKALLEDGYHEAGYRTGWQVVSNAFSALVACLVWNVLFYPTSFTSRVVLSLLPGSREKLYSTLHIDHAEYPSGQWCPSDPSVGAGVSRALIFATLGHFACCLGDTLASELGILSKSQPILITTFRPVPPGTNGGMTLGGTLASIFGGLYMGATMGLCLIAENVQCREAWGSVVLSMMGWGALAGGLGSLADSLLGATVQQTRYNADKKQVLQDESVSKDPVKVISGWNIFTNNQVNVISSIFTSIWMSFV